MSQPLSEDGIARSFAFAREYGALFEDNPGVLNVMCFFDKVNPFLESYIKKQKCPTLGLIEYKVYTDGIAWCALSRSRYPIPSSSMVHSLLICASVC